MAFNLVCNVIFLLLSPITMPVWLLANVLADPEMLIGTNSWTEYWKDLTE